MGDASVGKSTSHLPQSRPKPHTLRLRQGRAGLGGGGGEGGGKEGGRGSLQGQQLLPSLQLGGQGWKEAAAATPSQPRLPHPTASSLPPRYGIFCLVRLLSPGLPVPWVVAETGKLSADAGKGGRRA